ncbi:MSHA biogenesis protein MshK [Psychromonas sp. Urea-02u-13]|uniref:MSHA biogenesis protein MshK n=1 Tax=Psychromonas sp. Urea-02u-13 TaxID=2058326 RepID=UPI000C327122|nr:MSHA biogenesis protein MshK [Psychromonas sp. Urea-02u-13]PKG39833.1 MSHA biogenesis protein MshK [Psychromonas sp. Urea-02u-13]
MVKFILVSLFVSASLFAQSEVLVDPTRPLNFQVKKDRKVHRSALPTLQSIVVKAGKPQAILNNKLYKQGQWVSGYKITLIDAKKVLIEYQKKTYTLTLYSSNERFSH